MLRRGVDEPCRVALEFEVEGNRGRGRPRRKWRECLQKDTEMRGLEETDEARRRGADGQLGTKRPIPGQEADRT